MPVSSSLEPWISHICTKSLLCLLFPNGLDDWHIVFIMIYLKKAYSREDKVIGGLFPGHILAVTQ